jgi:putative transposase
MNLNPTDEKNVVSVGDIENHTEVPKLSNESQNNVKKKRKRKIEPFSVIQSSRGTNCEPFWTDLTKSLSEQLWSCAEKDSLVVDKESWNTSLRKKALNSWFTTQVKTSGTLVNSLLTNRSLPSLSQAIIDSVALVEAEEGEKENNTAKKRKLEHSKENDSDDDINDNDNEETKVELRTNKIRVYPSKEQKKILTTWFGAVRWTYNQCVNVVKKKGVTKDELKLKNINKTIMDTNSKIQKENPWLLQVPYDIKNNAIRDLDKARKAHFAKIAKNKKIDNTYRLQCSFKYRSKKDEQESIVIRGRDWGRKTGVYSNIFGPGKMKVSKSDQHHIPERMKRDFRFVRNRIGHYYLCVSKEIEVKDEKLKPLDYHGVVALDPGVRTFQTCYSADGSVVEWGKNDMNTIFKHCYAADRLQGRLANLNNNKIQREKTKRRRMKKAWLMKLDRIRNRVNEAHKKLSIWLCENHRVVLIPKFDTGHMIRKIDRKIGRKTARGMCTWAHFRFRQTLINKSSSYPWCKVIVCDEAYTSKTCGQCGELNHKLKGKKVFKCENCHYVADRDISAARNILMRYITRNNINIKSGHHVGCPVPLRACS